MPAARRTHVSLASLNIVVGSFLRAGNGQYRRAGHDAHAVWLIFHIAGSRLDGQTRAEQPS